MAAARPRVTGAVCAYNEAANIEQLLRLLLERDAPAFDELIVVSSGSIDGTDEIVRSLASDCPSLRLIAEPARRGKASAVNTVLREATGDLVLLIDADCLPGEGCLKRLTASVSRDGVGGAGSRNCVTNASESWVARCAAVLWELHHLVNQNRPVLGGDIIAFRKVVDAIPEETVNDDYAIEAALAAAGYRIEYEPAALVYMRAPATVRDFIGQRGRIYAGFRAESAGHRRKATQDWRPVAVAMAGFIHRRPADLPWLVGLLVLEAAARLSTYVNAIQTGRASYTSWEPARSTKGKVSPADARETAP